MVCFLYVGNKPFLSKNIIGKRATKICKQILIESINFGIRSVRQAHATLNKIALILTNKLNRKKQFTCVSPVAHYFLRGYNISFQFSLYFIKIPFGLPKPRILDLPYLECLLQLGNNNKNHMFLYFLSHVLFSPNHNIYNANNHYDHSLHFH